MMLVQVPPVQVAQVVQIAVALPTAAASLSLVARADQEVRVFTPNLIERLRAVNQAMRWLRENGHAATSIHLQGHLPMLQVDAAAAPLLVAASHGYNWRNLDKGVRACSVIFKDCAITWYEVVA